MTHEITPAEKVAIAEINKVLLQLSEFGLGFAMYELEKIRAECPRKKYYDGTVYQFPVKQSPKRRARA